MSNAYVLVAPKQFEYREYSEPEIKPEQVRVRSLVSGIKTGTELNLYRGETPFLDQVFDPEYRMFLPAVQNKPLYPLTLGSWMAGEVVQVGEAVQRLKVGDLVHGGSAHRPLNTFMEDQLYLVSPGTDLITELFTDPTIFALTAVHDAQVKLGDRVAVFGMGVLGLIAVQLARMNGAVQVIAVDPIARRRDLALQFGADQALDPFEGDIGLMIKDLTGRKGVDAAIEISGSYAALQQAIRGIQKEGLVVTAGYYKNAGMLNLGAEWHHNRPTMRSSMMVWGCSHRSYPMWDLKRVETTAISLLENGRISVLPMVSHQFAYHDAPKAYQLLDQHTAETVKVVLTYS